MKGLGSLLAIGIALLGGAVAALLIRRDSGYVLLSYDVWSIEMSLAMLLLLLGLTFLALYTLIRLASRLVHAPAELRAWRQRRGALRARQSLTRGLIELSEGNWSAAERHLLAQIDRSETPLMNYLAAARAAQLQGEHARRDDYLRLAHASMPSADIAVGLTQAELQLAHNQLEQALATLKHLRSVAPQHTYVLRLLRRLYEQLGDWDQLHELLPELRKRKIAQREELDNLEARVFRAFLERASLSIEKTRLDEVWRQVPRALRSDRRLVGDYAGYLLERDEHEKAEPLVRGVLQKHWDPLLVEIYGQLQTERPGAQLALTETWLKTNPRDPGLLLALGRLCLRAKLWGKARGYLEGAIATEGSTSAYRELGHLLEQLGERETALEIYRRGLAGTGGPEPVALPEISPSANKPTLIDREQEAQVPTPARRGAEPIVGT